MTGTERADGTPDALHEVLHAAVTQGASDVHLGVGDPPMIRVGAELVALATSTLEAQEVEAMIEMVLSDRARQQLADRSVVNVSYELPGVARFRVSAYRERGRIAAALRVVPVQIPSIQELGLPLDVGGLTAPGPGLVLVAGPRGSGRSTTLATLVDLIAGERACHIVTVEDPIEFVHERKRALVHQREVGSDVPTMEAGIRDLAHQDVDVVLLGAIEDANVAELAIAAADAGRLVLAPWTAQRGPDAIDRMIDAFPEGRRDELRSRLASVLRGVLVQRLLPAATGKGKVLASEVLLANDAVVNLIRNDKVNQLYSMLSGRGMDNALVELVREGRVTRDAALEVAHGDHRLLRLTLDELATE